MPEFPGVTHVALAVGDLGRSRPWHQRLFGAESPFYEWRSGLDPLDVRVHQPRRVRAMAVEADKPRIWLAEDLPALGLPVEAMGLEPTNLLTASGDRSVSRLAVCRQY